MNIYESVETLWFCFYLHVDTINKYAVTSYLPKAASFDKKCNARINDLVLTQKELKDQILHLEHREKEGTELLKQADCMWSCMEDMYKKRIAESLERQKDLLKQVGLILFIKI